MADWLVISVVVYIALGLASVTVVWVNTVVNYLHFRDDEELAEYTKREALKDGLLLLTMLFFTVSGLTNLIPPPRSMTVRMVALVAVVLAVGAVSTLAIVKWVEMRHRIRNYQES